MTWMQQAARLLRREARMPWVRTLARAGPWPSAAVQQWPRCLDAAVLAARTVWGGPRLLRCRWGPRRRGGRATPRSCATQRSRRCATRPAAASRPACGKWGAETLPVTLWAHGARGCARRPHQTRGSGGTPGPCLRLGRAMRRASSWPGARRARRSACRMRSRPPAGLLWRWELTLAQQALHGKRGTSRASPRRLTLLLKRRLRRHGWGRSRASSSLRHRPPLTCPPRHLRRRAPRRGALPGRAGHRLRAPCSGRRGCPCCAARPTAGSCGSRWSRHAHADSAKGRDQLLCSGEAKLARQAAVVQSWWSLKNTAGVLSGARCTRRAVPLCTCS